MCTETNWLSSYGLCCGAGAWNNISSWPSGVQPASQIPVHLFERNSGEMQLPIQNSTHYILNPILIPQGFYPRARACGKAQPGHGCRAEELAATPGGLACVPLRSQGLLQGHFRTALKKVSWDLMDIINYSVHLWQHLLRTMLLYFGRNSTLTKPRDGKSSWGAAAARVVMKVAWWL